MCLTMHCRAPIESIVLFFSLVIGISVSKGTIGRVRTACAKKAKKFDSEINLEGIREIATDEIFQQGKPILTGIDLDSHYTFMMDPAEDRTGDTWKRTLEKYKARGLQPAVNVSDNGSGLRKGIQEAFPAVSLQADAFHMLRDLGVEIQHIDKYCINKLDEYYKLKNRIVRDIGKKIPNKIWAKKYELEESIPLILRQVDEINILYEWLKEYVNFSGMPYIQNLSLCTWILDEMRRRFPEKVKFQRAVCTFLHHLPELLSFLKVVQEKIKVKSEEYNHIDVHDFMLLCQHMYCYNDITTNNYVERRLYRRFKEHLSEACHAIDEIVKSIHRASSMIENVNGRIRCFINLKREIPEHFMILIKVFFNTKKPVRSRRKDWKNKSAAERLTGKCYPEFLDIVCDPINYIIAK